MGSSIAARRPGAAGRGRHVAVGTVCLAAVLLAAIGAGEGLAWGRHQALARTAGRLESTWARDQSRGIPAADLSGLRRALERSLARSQDWWSPASWGRRADPTLGGLRLRTAALYAGEVARSRQAAAAVLTTWRADLRREGHWIPARLVQQSANWPLQLEGARTPAQAMTLAASWHAADVAARAAAGRAQSEAVARATSNTGPGGLISAAAGLIAIARSDNLDPASVPQLAGELRQELLGGGTGTATAADLTQALTALRSLIALNDQVATEAAQVLAPVNQAAAEQVAGSAALVGAFGADQAAFTAARTAAALQGVEGRFAGLVRTTTERLAAGRCGHPLPPGKVITISLSLQEMVFYDNGCAIQATVVTTGRPLLRTPTGTFHIFDKQTPYVFVSPWPPGSPFWYPTSPVTWVMEFDQGGYYIHDAPWEPPSAFGPNSENGVWASHGCVHTPEATMQWAFAWTPLGTPVIVSA